MAWLRELILMINCVIIKDIKMNRAYCWKCVMIIMSLLSVAHVLIT